MLSDLTTLVHQNVTKLLLSSVSMAALLFSAGEPGQLMPVDPAYLYQDTAGTTPVTAAGQSVALQLDQSKGLVLGPELVTNGDFAAGNTGWTRSLPSWSATSGVMINDGTNTSTTASVQQAGVVSAGKTYRIVFDLVCTSGSANLWLAASQLVKANISTSGRVSFTVLASVTGSLFFEANISSVVSIDNISVKELPGNHDTQPTVGSRPIYGKHPANGYRNMLASSEDFSAAVWAKSNSTITANTSVAPDGTTTADTLFWAASTAPQVKTATAATIPAGSPVTLSGYAKAGTKSSFRLILLTDGSNYAEVGFDISAGTAGTPAVVGTRYTAASARIVNVGNGWYRCSISASTNTLTTVNSWLRADTAVGSGDSILIWGAQLEPGSTATTYQRTGATSGVAWPTPPSYDITEAGQPDLHYLHYNGVSSFMVSPTITPGIDKAQVFVGMRKLSDATVGVVAELSVDGSTSAGAFYLVAPDSASSIIRSYGFSSRGTTSAAIRTAAGAYPAPMSNVISTISDISGDVSRLRINGAQIVTSSVDQGTGNYQAYPIYTGRRAGTSFPVNMLLYSKIVRFGSTLTADTIAATDRWTGQRIGVSL